MRLAKGVNERLGTARSCSLPRVDEAIQGPQDARPLWGIHPGGNEGWNAVWSGKETMSGPASSSGHVTKGQRSCSLLDR